MIFSKTKRKRGRRHSFFHPHFCTSELPSVPLQPTTQPEAFGIHMQEKWSIIVCWSGNATKNEHPVGRQIVLSRFSTRRHDHFTTELLYIGNGSALSRPGAQESAGGNAALGLLPCTWHFCALVSLWKA